MIHNYKKFTVVTAGRSGSTLLNTSLQQHPNVQMYGEVFNPNIDNQMLGIEDYNFKEEGCDFLKRMYLMINSNRFPSLKKIKVKKSRINSIGFKIIYDQAHSSPAKSAWDYLKSNRSIKIIHLIRENLFHYLVSYEIALKTRYWVKWDPKFVEPSKKESQGDIVPFEISPKRCKFMFCKLENKIKNAEEMFKHHPKIIITYKDLSENYIETIYKAQNFLGICQHAPDQLTTKHKNDPQVVIKNYHNLSQHFKNTKYSKFFNGTE